jgi:hypothetical protein
MTFTTSDGALLYLALESQNKASGSQYNERNQ